MIQVCRVSPENPQYAQNYFEKGLDNALRMGYIDYAGFHQVHSICNLIQNK